MKEKIIKTFLSGRKKKRRRSQRIIFKKNFVFVHNSPILTINVSQKERIKILKQKTF